MVCDHPENEVRSSVLVPASKLYLAQNRMVNYQAYKVDTLLSLNWCEILLFLLRVVFWLTCRELRSIIKQAFGYGYGRDLYSLTVTFFGLTTG